MTRFASPIITKALAVDGGKAFVPMIAIMSSPRVWANGDLKLEYGHKQRTVTEAEISVVGKPMATSGKSDIREAFVHYITSHGFNEAKR